MKTSLFTPGAIESATKLRQTLDLAQNDLAELNTALTTGGNGNTAERLAHDALLEILTAFHALKNRASRLHQHIAE